MVPYISPHSLSVPSNLLSSEDTEGTRLWYVTVLLGRANRHAGVCLDVLLSEEVVVSELGCLRHPEALLVALL